MEIVIKTVFAICCGILYAIGWCLGYDYKEISVYICIHIIPIVCIISATIPNLIVVSKLRSNSSCLNAFFKLILWNITGIRVFLYVTFYGFILRHYGYHNLSIYNPERIVDVNKQHLIFDQCAIDLQHIAEICGTTYEYVNIVIYVYLFLAILIFNGLISYLLKRFLK